MIKEFYFKRFNLTFKCHIVSFYPKIEPFQVLLLWVRVDLRAMAKKGYTAFPKTIALVLPDHQIFRLISKTMT